MAIEHRFKTVGGKLKMANLTPIRAIREHCVACVQSVYEVVDCQGEQCALYPFRLGDAHTVTEKRREHLAATARAAAGG